MQVKKATHDWTDRFKHSTLVHQLKLFSNIYNAFYLSNIAMTSDMVLVPPEIKISCINKYNPYISILFRDFAESNNKYSQYEVTPYPSYSYKILKMFYKDFYWISQKWYLIKIQKFVYSPENCKLCSIHRNCVKKWTV